MAQQSTHLLAASTNELGYRTESGTTKRKTKPQHRCVFPVINYLAKPVKPQRRPNFLTGQGEQELRVDGSANGNIKSMYRL